MVDIALEQVTDRVFTPYDIQNCLYDEARVGLFQRAINEIVRPGDVVVDGGSGTGVLGLLAAKAGADRVFCVELNAEYVDVIGQNARLNGLERKIVPIQANAAEIELEQPVDVIISEVISGGLFYEPQLQILANLRRGLRPGGTVVPGRMRNHVELIAAQDQLYGLTFAHDTRHQQLPGDRALSERALYLDVDFAAECDLTVCARVRVQITDDGLVNAIRIPYELDFSPSVSACRPTEFLLNPQVVFLPEPIAVLAGQTYQVDLQYISGDSPLNATITVERA